MKIARRAFSAYRSNIGDLRFPPDAVAHDSDSTHGTNPHRSEDITAEMEGVRWKWSKHAPGGGLEPRSFQMRQRPPRRARSEYKLHGPSTSTRFLASALQHAYLTDIRPLTGLRQDLSAFGLFRACFFKSRPKSRVEET